MNRNLLIFAILLSSQSIFAQKEFPNLNKGNRLYQKENYLDAEIQYRDALQKNQKSDVAIFNLGNALYRQEKYEEARKEFTKLTNAGQDAESLANVYHNIGNCLLQEGKFAESVEAYKQALKLNPGDNETRYNLAVANMLNRQQQQQQQQQQNDQNDKENMNKQNNDQNKPENKDGQQEKQQMQNVQKDDSQMTEENARRILDAFANDEKETQEKLNRSQSGGNKKYIEKDW
ncbi:MAG: tetratricopeptide repeat protein [Paludibacteraceae bacterium]|nr:tetratricopeptide repeat protein [Paludibacteraceae bacterium]